MVECTYCDKITSAAIDAKNELNALAARERLAAKGGEEERIIEKIERGEELTDNELDTLWKDTNRSDAIDAMYKPDKSLVKEITDRAIQKGDETKIEIINNELKEELKTCVKQGICGTETLTLAGI